jgi:thiol-disulfide isomerase/thioredoxin
LQVGVGSPGRDSQADTKLILKDGTVLRGNIELDNPTDSRLSFRDEVIGLFSIERSNIVSKERLDSLVYEWNGNIQGWTSLDSDQLTGWQADEKGFLRSNKSDSHAYLGIEVPRSFATSMTLSCNTRPSFEIAFGPDPEKALRLATVRNRLILGTSDDFEVIGEIPEGKWSMSFRLEWNFDTNEFRFLDSQGRSTTVKNRGPETMNGILFKNLDASLVVEVLKLYSSLDGGKLDSATSIPPTQQSSTQSLARFLNGMALQGNPMLLEKGIMTWESESLGRVKFSTQKLASLELPGRSTQETSEHKLELGQNSVSGRLQFGSTKAPLSWQCIGQANSVALNPDLSTSIRLKSSKSINLNEFDDLAYSRSGDVIPVRLSRFAESNVELSTPFSSLRQVSAQSIRAIELFRQGKPLEHSFTKESREQLLGFPRATDAALYRNALIGANGDLLRGIVVAINDSSVEMEVRLETCLISRDSVSAVVFLDEPADLSNRDDESRETQSATAKETRPPSFRIGLPSGYTVEGRLLKAESDIIVCQSDWLGELSIPINMITSVQLGSHNENTGSYSTWNTKTLASPAWIESGDTAQQESKLVGTTVEDFQLASLSGDSFRLRDHAGQVVVLDFWATWCGPCIKLLPEYLEVTKGYSETEVLFLGVNATETPDTVRDFLKTKKLERFETLFDYDGKVSEAMSVRGIPFTVLIGPSGKVEYVHRGYTKNASTELKQAIEHALGRGE